VRLNGRLGPPSRSTHVSEGPAADEGPGDAILDYFNLCAEEYVMQKMGVIPDFVWDVWLSGIHDCARQNHIKAAWGTEMEANCSYYGFDLQKVMRKHHMLHAGECRNRENCLWDKAFSEMALSGDE
jgi:predicted nucleic acid-binding Zn finger protein